MKDGLIVTLAVLANEEPKGSPIEVTLCVGGFLVSGEVTSARRYCEEHSFSKEWFNSTYSPSQDESSEDISSAQSEPEDDRPNLLHLANAQFFSVAGNPIPSSGVPVRIMIEDIHSLSFGRLKAEPVT